MAVTAFWYAKSFVKAFNAEIDFVDVQDKVALTSSSYTPNQDTHDYFDDVTNELTTANGYTAGGQALVTPSLANTLNVVKLDSDDPVWTTGAGETLTARIAVYYQNTAGASSTDPLLCWVDFGQNETASNGGTFTIVQSASGIATITPTDATGFP